MKKIYKFPLNIENTIWNVIAQLTYLVDREVKKWRIMFFSSKYGCHTYDSVYMGKKPISCHPSFHATLVFLLAPEVVGCRQAVWSNCLGQYRVSHKHSP